MQKAIPQDQFMLAKYAGLDNLADNPMFWVDVWQEYHGMILTLPLEATAHVVRDLLDAIDCNPGACGDCCRSYSAVQVTPRDLDRLAAARVPVKLTDDPEDPTVMALSLKGGCQFLRDNRCIIYRHRPDGCHFFPIQWGLTYDDQGQPVDRRLRIKLACPQSVSAIRTLVRTVIKTNPHLTLTPTLVIKPRPVDPSIRPIRIPVPSVDPSDRPSALERST